MASHQLRNIRHPFWHHGVRKAIRISFMGSESAFMSRRSS
jgi:hypothetical protein